MSTDLYKNKTIVATRFYEGITRGGCVQITVYDKDRSLSTDMTLKEFFDMSDSVTKDEPVGNSNLLTKRIIECEFCLLDNKCPRNIYEERAALTHDFGCYSFVKDENKWLIIRKLNQQILDILVFV